jgi:beta-lactamase superfamily II metal-dependent hydrolase
LRRTFELVLTLALAAAVGSAQSKSSKSLDIYFIDTEGGHSTLYVSPSGESLLMDTGSPGTAAMPTASWLPFKRPA